MKKQLTSILLVLCIIFSTTQTTYASTNEKRSSEQVTICAKQAYVKNVDEYGSNLTNDIIDGTESTVKDTKLKVNKDINNNMVIYANILGEDIAFTATPTARSENGNIVFYDCISSNPNYTVLNLSYEKEISGSSIYFRDFYTKARGTNDVVLKLYIKDNSSNTRDYILLESYDFYTSLGEEFINELPENNLLAAWALKEFKPISTSSGEIESDIMPLAYVSEKNSYVSKTFTSLGDKQTHTIYYNMTADYENVPKGSNANIKYSLQVTKKTMTFTINTNANSTKNSYLAIEGVTLRQGSVPNTAWYSTTVAGTVDYVSGSTFEVSLGVSLGLLSASLSLPSSFTTKTSSLTKTYNGYINNATSGYTRNIKTVIGSKCLLKSVNSYYSISGKLRDYGNKTQAEKILPARWDFKVTNSAALETYSQYHYQDIPISIK